jgi:putative transposase
MRLSNVSLNNLVNLKKVITDQAPSTKVAMVKVIKAFKLKPDCHCTSKYLNNLIEQDHRHIKVRKTRYQSINTAKEYF